jgi:hypothetical protein
MDYEQRMRLKGRLQRCGAPALLEEVIRLGEEVDLLKAQMAARSSSASGTPTGPAVERRVLVDFGHGWQVVADGDGEGLCSGLGGCECPAVDG